MQFITKDVQYVTWAHSVIPFNEYSTQIFFDLSHRKVFTANWKYPIRYKYLMNETGILHYCK